MSFFDLHPSAIDLAALEAFLSERLPESLNLDYKRELSESTYETIVAMANTYGGIVLVGVDEDPAEPTRPQLPPIGVEPDTREKLVNQSYTRFQPPFAPDVIPVSLASGNVVLVVRVDPGRVERPLVLTRGDSHRVLIRLEARNAQADRYRLAALFSEPNAEPPSTAIQPTDWSLMRGARYPLDDLNRPALTARAAVEARIPRDRLERVVIDTRDRDVLAAAMRRASLGEWLTRMIASWGVQSWSSSDWVQTEQAQSNLSWCATLRWRGHFDSGIAMPLGGQAALQLPAGLNVFSGRLSLLIDASYDPDSLASDDEEAAPYRRLRLSLEDVYYLIRALLESAVDVVAPATFPRLLGIDGWERIGPVVYLHSFQDPSGVVPGGLGHFITCDKYIGKTQPNLELPSYTFRVPRGVDIESVDARSGLVKEWLARLLLDMGLRGFEQDIANL